MPILVQSMYLGSMAGLPACVYIFCPISFPVSFLRSSILDSSLVRVRIVQYKVQCLQENASIFIYFVERSGGVQDTEAVAVGLVGGGFVLAISKYLFTYIHTYIHTR